MSTPLQPRQWSGFGSQEESPLHPQAPRGPMGLGRIEEVNAADIDFSQADIDDSKVERMAAKKKAGHQMPLPIASKAGGKVRIQDGHHRAMADMRLGKKRIQVRVF